MVKRRQTYLPIEEYKAALSEFFGGDEDKVRMVLSVTAACTYGEENGMYVLKYPYRQDKKNRKDSPFNRFIEKMEEYKEGGVVSFLCNRFGQRRINVGASYKNLTDRVALSDVDDARISNALEKELMKVVGDDRFGLAKEMLLRLYDVLPEDASGQLRKVAMDMVAVGFQIDNEVQAHREFREDIKNKGKSLPKPMHDTVKDLRATREKMMGLLGITAKEIERKRGNSNTGFMKAAESLRGKIEEAISTADLIEDTKKFLKEGELEFSESADVLGGENDGIDEIDLALIKEPAGETKEEDVATP